MTPPVDVVRERLTARGLEAKGRRTNFAAKCPAHTPSHGSTNRSLSVKEASDGKVLVRCHWDPPCSFEAIIGALDLTAADLFPQDDHAAAPKHVDRPRRQVAADDYHDEHGELLYQAVRYDPKQFMQRRPDGDGGWAWSTTDVRKVPYRLPQLREAVAVGRMVFVVEGEKDADRLAQMDLAATCNIGGAGKWLPEYTPYFTGAHVAVIGDNDDAGRAHVAQVAAALHPVAASVRVVDLPDLQPRGDVSDWLDADNGRAELETVVTGTKPLDDDTLARVKANHGSHSTEDAGVPRRRVRLTPASTITPKPVRWTWAGRLPVGELSLTPGRGGIGKSTFHAWIIARLTCGDLPGVHLGTPKACIVAAVEDSWERTIVPRLIAAGAKLDRVFRADVVTEDGEQMTLSLPADNAELEAAIRSVGAALVSVDPLMSAVAVGLDTHKDRDVRQALEPLSQLADRTGVTILGNAHFRKGLAADPLMMAMGSAAFGNVVRAALGFARDVDDEGKPLDDGSCVITQIKNNLGRMDLPSLRYRIDSTIIDTDEGAADVGRMVMLGETDRSVDAIFTTNGGGKKKDASALEAAEDWLTDVLTGVGSDGMERKEVIKLGKAEGHTERTLERAGEQIDVIARRDDSARGRPSTWYHPDYPPGGTGEEPLADNETAQQRGKPPLAFDYPPGVDGGGKSNGRLELAECHICRNGPTIVRDDQGRPAHPSCTEGAAA